jgi:uncharacterized protein (TIGR02271 family)
MHMHGASIVRQDGTRGTVVAGETPERLIVEFADGARVVDSADTLVRLEDGSYRLPIGAKDVSTVAPDQIVIPVVAEELTIETYRVARSRVRVDKRVETREETVDVPTIVEEVVVERIPVNKLIDDADEVPTVREEGGTTVIPVIEEVLVVQKQLMVREEVRMFKRSKPMPNTQTVVLRREIVKVHPGSAVRNGAARESRGEHREGASIMRTVVGLFDDRQEAMRAYSALVQEGYAKADLDILTSDDQNDKPKLAHMRE